VSLQQGQLRQLRSGIPFSQWSPCHRDRPSANRMPRSCK